MRILDRGDKVKKQKLELLHRFCIFLAQQGESSKRESRSIEINLSFPDTRIEQAMPFTVSLVRM